MLKRTGAGGQKGTGRARSGPGSGFQFPKKQKELREKYPGADTGIRCRLVMVTLDNAAREVLCTSLPDKETFPAECFAGLYRFRWNIEEGYKRYKCRMQPEAFSGKTAPAVKQAFFAFYTNFDKKLHW